MVRQYKIHLDLDGKENKIWDVTNGKLRFYEPSDLGIEVGNNMWGTGGIGVIGERAINHPQLEFKLETFGDNVRENYELLTEFVNDILSKKFVTLEYSTEWFQVFADIALSKQTKTEGYGNNGTFSETVTFDIITKWYTYENLTFSTLQNGEIIDGVSKIYGGSINKMKLPNLNLISGLKKEPTSVTIPIGGRYSTIKIFSSSELSSLKGKTVTTSIYIDATNSTYDLKAQLFANPGSVAVGTIVKAGAKGWSVVTSVYPSEATSGNIAIISSGTVSVSTPLVYSKPKVEEGQVMTPWLPSATEVTNSDYATYAGYRYIKDKAYTYYGETNIDRLSRWEIIDPFFSIIAKLTPSKVIDGTKQVGLKFFNENLNEYSAILFNVETPPDYITINTDVNDEFYLSTTKGTTINAFPSIDMQRYRTRIFTKGQMTLQNVSSVEIRVKRKVDFI